MATAIDFGLLQTFDFIFPFIFVWAVVFATLQKSKLIGGAVAIDSTVAFAISLMILLSQTLIDILNFMIPWFTVAIIFFMLLMLMFMVFGASEKDIFAYVKTDKGVGWALIGIALIIVIAAFGNVLGQQYTEEAFDDGTQTVETTPGGTATQDFEGNVTAIFSHPKVLGMIILFAVAIFTVGLLSGSMT